MLKFGCKLTETFNSVAQQADHGVSKAKVTGLILSE